MRKLKQNESVAGTNSRPAITPQAQESKCIALAMQVAEKQLTEGTASSQVITHFLKLATENAKLEREKLEHENELLKAKTKAIESAEEIKAMYAEALKAMTIYAGEYVDEED